VLAVVCAASVACSEAGVTPNCPALLLSNADASAEQMRQARAAAADAGCLTLPSTGDGAVPDAEASAGAGGN
jgi:hypothetical protein